MAPRSLQYSPEVTHPRVTPSQLREKRVWLRDAGVRRLHKTLITANGNKIPKGPFSS